MIFITVIAVSLDAYIVGLSIGHTGKFHNLLMVYLASFSLFISASFMYFASMVDSVMRVISLVSGGILILLGLKCFFVQNDKKSLMPSITKKYNLLELAILGVSISIDSSLGAVFLINESLNKIVPLLMMAGHFCFLELGSCTERLMRLISGVSRFSGLLLIFMGLTRFF